jgi:hypothetical protein
MKAYRHKKFQKNTAKNRPLKILKINRIVITFSRFSISISILTQIPHCDGHKCDHLGLRFATAKSGLNAAGFIKLQKSSLSR